MTEIQNPYEFVPANTVDHPVEAETRFYVVSPRKAAILLIGTLGLYSLYWFYKQWELYKESQPFDSPAGKIWPFMRAIFAIFFTHSLFAKVKESAPTNPELMAWNARSSATLVVTLQIAGQLANRLSVKGIGSPITDILGIVMLLLTAPALASAQRMFNVASGDADGSSNANFTGANIAWLVLGAVMWVLIIVGLSAGESGM